PKIGRSQSASSALQYSVVSIVCEGPLRPTDILSVTTLKGSGVRMPGAAGHHEKLEHDMWRWRSHDGSSKCRGGRTPGAGIAAVLLVLRSGAQGARRRG